MGGCLFKKSLFLILVVFFFFDFFDWNLNLNCSSDTSRAISGSSVLFTQSRVTELLFKKCHAVSFQSSNLRVKMSLSIKTRLLNCFLITIIEEDKVNRGLVTLIEGRWANLKNKHIRLLPNNLINLSS